jgi:hypothetical protein
MEPLVLAYVVLIVLNLRFWAEGYWLKWKATRFYTEAEYQALLTSKGLDRINLGPINETQDQKVVSRLRPLYGNVVFNEAGTQMPELPQ